jgi:hypothetical protein
MLQTVLIFWFIGFVVSLLFSLFRNESIFEFTVRLGFVSFFQVIAAVAFESLIK